MDKSIKSAGVLLFSFFCSVNVVAAPELRGSPEELQQYLLGERSVLVISGNAEEKVAADRAVVSLMVRTKEDKFKAALDKNLRIRNEIRNKLVTAGIGADKIAVAKYSSTPSFGWFGDKPTSYEVRNEVKITLEREDHLLVIAELVDTFNEVRFINTSLEHMAKDQAKARALDNALIDVNQRKELYEKRLGVALAPVRVLDQTVNEQAPPVFQGLTVKSKSFASAPMAESDVASMETGSFGEIVYRAQTQVEFVVKPKPR